MNKYTTHCTVNRKKHTKMFLLYLPQNPVDSHKIWYTLSWINLPQSIINVFHLTWTIRLHYLVKLEISVFVKIIMLGKRNSRNFTYWLWFYLVKKIQLLTLNHIMANLIRKSCTKLYQNRPRFVKDMTETFRFVFRFTVLTAVHLQNANASFTR